MLSFKTKSLIACPLLAFAASVSAQQFVTLSDEQLLVLQRGLSNSQQNFKPLDDNVLNAYLASLVEQLDGNSRTYVVFSDSKSVNAVAMLGDVIMFHAGMALFTRSEGELAGVLAHELAHISQEHFPRLPAQAGQFNKLVIASLLAALLTKPEIADEVLVGSSSIGQSLTYDVLRSFEREADQHSVRNLIAHGFDTAEYSMLLGRMASASEAGLPEYLSTHPISSNRVAELNSYIRNVSERAQPEIVERDDLSYWLIRSRLGYLINATYDDGLRPPELAPLLDAYEDLLERLPGSENSPKLADNAANWIIAYELGAAYTALRNFEKAREIVQTVYDQDPENPILIAALLELYAIEKNRTTAVKLLAGLTEKTRLDPAVAKAETKLWFELDEQVSYEIATAYLQYVSGNLSGAKELVANLREKFHKDGDAGSNALARLGLLEMKIELLSDS